MLTTSSLDNITVTPKIFNINEYVRPFDDLMYIEAVLGVIGIPGNVLTIFVLASSARLIKKPINLFLIHQSFIDLLACICMTAEVLAFRYSPVLAVVCHMMFTRITSNICLTASTYNLTFLVVERSLAITNPFKYDSAKVLRRMPLVYALIWIISIVNFIVVPLSTEIFYGHCFIIKKIMFTSYFSHGFVPHLMIVSFIFPTTMMTVCYTRMFSSLSESRKMFQKSGKNIAK